MPLLEPGRRICDRFILLGKLGDGGFAEVWGARDTRTPAEVALKILSPALARSEQAWSLLQHEHAIVSRLDHPGILRVFEPVRCTDAAVLPMELAPNGDLRRLRGQPYLRIVPVLIEVGEALAHAHERGVVHRDLKPGNVLFDSRQRAKLADFGAAAVEAAGYGDIRQQGSPFSASPQQLRGEPPAPADDIYGLGALAYELLSGYPPHYPDFDSRLGPERPIPRFAPAHQVPPRLESLVMRMLATRPQDRPASMRAVLDELHAALQDTLGLDELVGSLEARRAPAAVAEDEDDFDDGEAASTADDVIAVNDEVIAVSDVISTRAAPTVARTAAPPARVPSPPVGRAAPLGDFEPERPAGRGAFGDHPGHAQPPRGIGGGRSSLPPPPPEEPPADWSELQAEIRDVRARPDLLRIEPMRKRRLWPWLLAAALVGVMIGVFFWLPRYAAQQPSTVATAPADSAVPAETAAPTDAAPGGPEAGAAQQAEDANAERLAALAERRARVEERLAALEKRAAGVWGGPEYASARARLAEATAALETSNLDVAAARLEAAERDSTSVEGRAAAALTAQLEAGDRALAAGQAGVARQAFEAARRIDPINRRAGTGLERSARLDDVLALVAKGENALRAGDGQQATQLFEQALKLDPASGVARAGLARARGSQSDDAYARSLGEGFAALVAGRYEDARAAFNRAKSMRPNSREAEEGLAQVSAASQGRSFAGRREQAAQLESEERWTEALAAYEQILRDDASLEFARAGRQRVAPRAELDERLQRLIDRPERLADEGVRAEAGVLLERARAVTPSGPVIRSQIARLELLLPDFDKPVRLAMESDNETQISIQRVGAFGTFFRREIELRPGRYTVVGTRVGYRDVRRDITVAPGQALQTVSITCDERI